MLRFYCGTQFTEETQVSDLRQMRLDAGLGLAEAAKKLQIGTTTLWRYETDKTKKKDHAVVQRMVELYDSPNVKATA